MNKFKTIIGNIALSLVGLLLTVCILMAVEVVFRYLHKPETNEIVGEYTQGFNIPDPDYGYRPKPDSSISVTKKDSTGRSIYSVRYSIDEFSRRVTPQENTKDRNRFLIFFGCSFTFGEGIEDDQTLPYFAARQAPCYATYNYGYSGYGPQQMLVRLHDPGFYRQIAQKKGIMIYSPAHVSRAIGSYKVSTSWGKNFPYFYLDQAGNLKRDGDFQSGRPSTSFIYGALSKSVFLDTFLRPYDIPHTFSDSDIETTARIIEKSFQLFNSQFNDSKAYFMLLPGVDYSDREVARHLVKSGIQVLDFSDRKEFRNDGYVIPNDGHPTALWNEQLAGLIVEKLGISGKECP